MKIRSWWKKTSKEERVATALLFLYLLVILTAHCYCVAGVFMHKLFFVVALVGAVLGTWILRRIARLARDKVQAYAKVSRKEPWIWFVLVFLISFGILMLHIYRYWPGSFSPDSLNQLSQAVHGNYLNWHPFLHTLLFFTLPIKVFQKVESILPMQVFWFSLSLAFLTMTLRKEKCPRWLCITEVVYVLMMPVTCDIIVFPWKDVAMAIFAMTLIALFFRVYKEEEVTRGGMIAFLLAAVGATLMRHNAVLFTLPLVLVVAFRHWKNRRRALAFLLGFALLFAAVRGPVFALFHVQKSEQSTAELTGACFATMGNVLVKDPASMDDDIRNFLYSVAPKDVWDREYRTGEFKKVKYNDRTNLAQIDQAGARTVMLYTLRTAMDAKRFSLQGFLELTGMVWKLDGKRTWKIAHPAPSHNLTKWLPDVKKQAWLSGTVEQWRAFVDNSLLRYPFGYLGWIQLLLLAFPLTLIKKKKDLRILLPAVPLLIHNFGTALLLAGADWRFFYFSFLIAIPTLFLMLREAKRANAPSARKEGNRA